MGSLLSRARELARNPQLIRNSSASANLELTGFSANPQNPQPAGVQRNPQPNPQPGIQQWQTLYGQPAPAPAPTPEEQDKQPPQRQAQRGTLVAVLHSTPEWVAARDNWHRHLFSCGVCQQHHRRQIRRPFTPSPCEVGQELHAIYEQISQSI